MEAYITRMAAFLPNAPVDNDHMEQLLGMIDGKPSRTRRIILRNNGIKLRHYAIDPATGAFTHNNATLTAAAVRKLNLEQPPQCLCCGTSTPDQIMPGHAAMVHGELGQAPCEIVTTSGICISGIMALKYACLQVAAGQTETAVATGSELASSFMRAPMCAAETISPAQLEQAPQLAFDSDFLRWMLSDGAAAALVAAQPAPTGISLRVEWIEQRSFANELATCMYAGAAKNADGSLRGWREFDSLAQALKERAFLVKQDVKLLNSEIITTAVERALLPIIARHNLNAADITWFLPHYSSEYFRQRLYNGMQSAGFDIPMERWFSNLTTRGNTGAASIYIMLEELLGSGKLRRGDTILCFVPESGRFSMCYMLLTVV